MQLPLPRARHAIGLGAALAAVACSGESSPPPSAPAPSRPAVVAAAPASAPASAALPAAPASRASAPASAPRPQVLQEVPVAFRGEWNTRLADCGSARNDSRLRIHARRLRFHESEGPVTRVEVPQPSDIVVTVRLTGEGQQRLSTRRLRLSADGQRLQDVSEGTPGLVRLRCPVAAAAAPAASAASAAVPAGGSASHLVDPTIAPAVAGTNGWNWHQSAQADLDGDGKAERVVLTARVDLRRGRPAWDDGQPWQVYVEAPGGRRTYLYAQRLQLGTLAMRVSRAEAGQPATIVLLEQLPDRLGVYEATYQGPGRVGVATRFRKDLDPRGDLASPRLP